MSKEKYSPIKFQMEETIWLDHRSQSAEITNLELEADIELIENGDHVNITGNLVLSGRFLTTDDENEESLDLESSSLAEQLHFQPLRVEQKELIDGKNRGKIEKRFPIDVTVPANKIENMEDVLVSVDALDYSISDGHRLNIEAEVSIAGILSNSVKEVNVNNREENQTGENPLQREFHVAATREEPPSESETSSERNSEPLETSSEESNDEQQKVAREEDKKEDELEAVPSGEEKANEELEQRADSLEEDIEEEQQVEASQEEDAVREAASSIEDDAVDSEEEEKVVPLFKQELRTNIQSLPSQDDASAASEAEERQGSAEDQEGAEEEQDAVARTSSYLTQLMSGEDEQESYTRLKVCIIQKNESLEDISERYEVSVHEIMRVNQMESSQIEDGQIIYIPKN